MNMRKREGEIGKKRERERILSLMRVGWGGGIQGRIVISEEGILPWGWIFQGIKVIAREGILPCDWIFQNKEGRPCGPPSKLNEYKYEYNNKCIMVEYMSQQELLLKANLDTQIIMRQIISFCKLISQLKTIWIFIKKSHQGIIFLFYYFFHVLFLIFYWDINFL